MPASAHSRPPSRSIASRVARTLLVSLLVLFVSACPQDPIADNADLGGGGGNDQGGGGDTAQDTGGDDQGNGDLAGDVGGDGGGGNDQGREDQGGGGPDLDDDTGGGQNFGCVPSGVAECDNPGFDDDCDGIVDEICGCLPQGTTQDCYFGDPGHLSAPNTACRAGVQTCGLEFWGECTGAIGPGVEICDNDIDDDCDGEVDDLEECPTGNPPTAICEPNFEGPVLSSYHVQGGYDAPNGEPMSRAVWAVRGPPGHSYDLTYDPDGLGLSFFADVTGSYTFTLTVFNEFGEDSCDTVFNATTADVLRIELFWNPDFEDGDDGVDCSDLDLYLLRDPPAVGNSYTYYRPSPNEPPGASCHWRNCATCTVPYTVGDGPRERECRQFLTDEALTCPEDGICPDPVLDWYAAATDDDPRLDLDDVEGHGPENINVRTPRAGSYRVGVHFFNPDNAAARNCADFRESEAFVRVICAGRPVFESEGVPLVGNPGRSLDGQFWEVGDINVSYSSTGNAQCEFVPFGVEDCRHVCIMSDSDDGCSTSEIRNVMGSCIDAE
jgi:hypothetical protein